VTQPSIEDWVTAFQNDFAAGKALLQGMRRRRRHLRVDPVNAERRFLRECLHQLQLKRRFGNLAAFRASFSAWV
jgi:hypothetical protein